MCSVRTESGPAPSADQGPVSGVVPLTPVQRWFLEPGPAEPGHFGQWMALELAGDVDAGVLRTALAGLVEHHDALRMRFERTGDGWRQVNPPPGFVDLLECREVSGLDTDRVHAGFDLAAGPLLRAVLFAADGRPVLLIAIHHLVADGASWRILLDDLNTAYRQAAAGEPVDLGPRTTSFRDWAVRLESRARDGGFDQELAHWARVTSGPAGPLPAEGDGPDTVASARSVTMSLSQVDTRALLQDVPSAYRTRIDDVLLAALGRVLAGWTGRERVLLDLEGHGREQDVVEGADLSRTVGWFTTVYPAALHLPSGGGWGQTLRSVKEQLRAIPHHGLGYGALRYLTADGADLSCQPPVSFNYLGQLDQALPSGGLVAGIAHGLDATADPDTMRAHQLEIVGRVEDQRLRLTWTYSSNRHHGQTVARLAGQFLVALGEIIAHCAQPDAGRATPSDFPLARLDQATIATAPGGRRSWPNWGSSR